MKLTKSTSLFLAFLLLFSNLGMAFNVHYCGDEVASVSLKTITIHQNSIDECCGIREQKTQCCNDKIVQFQEKSDNLILKIVSFTPYTVIILNPEWHPVFTSEVLNSENKSISSYSFEANAPTFFKLYSQYIFYA